MYCLLLECRREDGISLGRSERKAAYPYKVGFGKVLPRSSIDFISVSFGTLSRCPSLGRTRVQERSRPLHTHHFTLARILQLLLTLFWAVTAHLIHHLQSVSFSQKLSLKCVTNSSKEKDLLGLQGEWKPEKDTEHICHQLHLPLVLICESQPVRHLRESRRLGRHTDSSPRVLGVHSRSHQNRC